MALSNQEDLNLEVTQVPEEMALLENILKILSLIIRNRSDFLLWMQLNMEALLWSKK